MPTLHWIGKEKVINHHLDVPYRVLEHRYTFNHIGTSTSSVSDSATVVEPVETTGNKIIHGDNLEALKSLLPEYEGKIKCIYIDPPYNTGNEGWVYNDNVNDPKIKKWLGQVVGKEAEDLTRHDKWLCMMYPRLKLLHKLLAEDGVILISIDDNEHTFLKLIMDEIFGGNNFIANIIWRGGKRNAAKYISNSHEYILFYTKNLRRVDELGVSWKVKKSGLDDIYRKHTELIKKFKDDYFIITKELKKWFKELPESSPSKDHSHYCNVDKTGIYFASDISRGGGGGPQWDLINPITGNLVSKPSRGWAFSSEEEMRNALQNDLIHFTPNDGVPCFKRYLKNGEQQILDTVFYKDRRAASKALAEILGKNIFEFPKDKDVLEYYINAVSDENSIILDSFAGSGTTAHAILNLNKLDGGNRKFICIEMGDYAETITAERVKRVIKGYGSTGSPTAEGTGGSFDYYELGPPLFNEDNEINELVGVEKLRQYIYYTETKCTLSTSGGGVRRTEEDVLKTRDVKDNDYLLNKHHNTAYYFYYEQDMVTTLNHDFLSTIKTKAEQYVIYADNCLLTKEFMTKHHIIFKKIPRDITKF
jgi:adenine-specific DNA-methyltransferase